MNNNKKTCKNCWFYRVTENTKYGRCVRYPPRFVDGYGWMQPSVKDDEECGEYKWDDRKDT